MIHVMDGPAIDPDVVAFWKTRLESFAETARLVYNVTMQLDVCRKALLKIATTRVEDAVAVARDALEECDEYE